MSAVAYEDFVMKTQQVIFALVFFLIVPQQAVQSWLSLFASIINPHLALHLFLICWELEKKLNS